MSNCGPLGCLRAIRTALFLFIFADLAAGALRRPRVKRNNKFGLQKTVNIALRRRPANNTRGGFWHIEYPSLFMLADVVYVPLIETVAGIQDC
jgi:hypothetical protein